jgi:MIP family channel proteins
LLIPCASCKKECFAELLGTYTLVTVGPGSVIVASLFLNHDSLVASLFVALAFGTTVGLMIVAFGKHSGAMLNPAITFGSTVAKILNSKYFAQYLFFQTIGGLLAGLTLKELFSSTTNSDFLGSTRLANGITPILGVALEAAGTFVLTLSALIASTKLKNPKFQGLMIGSTLFFLILLIGPLTGAGFNPSRSLGPSLASGYYQNLLIYIIGPILGAIMAGLLFRAIESNVKNSRNLVCLC